LTKSIDADTAPCMSVTARLQKEIARSGKSLRQVATESDVDIAALSRFMSGQRVLGGQAIDRLAEVLGLELVQRRNRRKEGP